MDYHLLNNTCKKKFSTKQKARVAGDEHAQLKRRQLHIQHDVIETIIQVDSRYLPASFIL